MSMLPLVLLLYPEGLLVPNTITWTLESALTFGVVLVLGSMLWVAIAIWLLSLRPRFRSSHQ
jgi:hypothetical protein